VLAFLIVLAAVASCAYLLVAPEDWVKLRETADDHLRPVKREVVRVRAATQGFRATLRARTRWVIVTPVIVGLNIVVFLFMAAAQGSVGEPATLLAWGASLGRLTANAEWWRLATALFVHAGMLHLVANTLGFAQVGSLLERLLGPASVASVYVAAGVLAGLVNISEYPLAIHAGASGAVFGIYGLLLAVTGWGLVRRTPLIPFSTYESLAPAAALFLLYSIAADGLTNGANLIGLLVGGMSGLVLAKEVAQGKPDLRLTAITTSGAAVVTIIVVILMPFRGLVDARPAIDNVVAIEDQTAGPYRTAVQRFRKGQTDTKALTDLITRTIMPELQAARARVEALEDVASEQKPLIDDAAEYLRLREASWLLRSEGLRKGSTATLRDADRAEHASLQALERVRIGQRRLQVLAMHRSAGV
jgi:membrane associated rhomboid family serine protease